MKLGDLQEIAEYDVLVVPHGARHHRLVDALDVLLHHVEQIPGELLLSFHQLPENGSTTAITTSIYCPTGWSELKSLQFPKLRIAALLAIRTAHGGIEL